MELEEYYDFQDSSARGESVIIANTEFLIIGKKNTNKEYEDYNDNEEEKERVELAEDWNNEYEFEILDRGLNNVSEEEYNLEEKLALLN